MFALTLKGGTAQSTVPDVCKTPAPPAGPVPIPYVNIFQCNMVNPSTASQKVFIDGAPALNVKSQTLISNGDEAGVNGGVSSNKFIGQGEFIAGSQKVQFEGKAAVSQGAQTKHNNGNTVGICSMSGQSKVMVQ
ncbi:MAG: DUF4150 domain-containing protein [Candidatus Accumulibacter sp.]|jgi:uncharacterized Zn-binding protein involved in type VI secretion|nr:DUF4150 domain-containing protein [Accumulibacter sp.]